MRYSFSKSIANGVISAPPSKSMAHRLLICAGLSEGKSIIKGITQSKDMQATLNCLKSLGAEYTLIEDTVYIQGIDFKNIKYLSPLNCLESGSTIRFFAPIALLFNKEITLLGAPSLMKRPMDIYKKLSLEHNFKFQQIDDGLIVKGPLTNGIFTVNGNISSQFITGILFALPLLDGDSEIRIIPPIESYSYLKLTLDALSMFGINIVEKDNTFYISGNQHYICGEHIVEGDYSNSAFLDAFNCLGGSVLVEGLKSDSLQGDKVYKNFFPMIENGSPTIDISDCPDLGPVLFALAAAKNGAIFKGTERLRIKESDRIASMGEELSKFGVEIIVDENSVIIPKSTIHFPTAHINGHNDHRIVMALSLLLSITGGEIEGCEAVCKSYPDFFKDIKKLGIGAELI